MVGEGPAINLSFEKQERFTEFCCKEISCFDFFYSFALFFLIFLVNCMIFPRGLSDVTGQISSLSLISLSVTWTN